MSGHHRTEVSPATGAGRVSVVLSSRSCPEEHGISTSSGSLAPSGTEEARPAPARLPEWARKRGPLGGVARPVRVLLREQDLNTVCEEARCPNLGECFSRGTAAFMLLGDRCTRRCGYCAVTTARPRPLDPGEPARVARAAARLRLRYVVLTSVDRDDLPDGGAAQFAATIEGRTRRAAGGGGRGADAGLRGRSRGAAGRARCGARGLQPQHRDRPAPLPAAAPAGSLRAEPRSAAPRPRSSGPRRRRRAA